MIVNIITSLFVLCFIVLTLYAIKQIRAVWHQTQTVDPNIYGSVKEEEVIRAKLCWRKNDALVFDKDGELFAVKVPAGSFRGLKFVKGQTYRLASESNGLITILR